MTQGEIDDAIWSAIGTADRRWGHFKSTHEGLGVLIEELDELKSAIHANKTESVREEAIQIAAVATRIAYSMSEPTTIERSIP